MDKNMTKPNACLVSFFMGNIDYKLVGLQRSVVEKYNPSKYHHYQIKVDIPHAVAIDYFWALNGCITEAMIPHNIPQQVDHDVVLFLDIDCIPLAEHAIDLCVNSAAAGNLIGNAQRSNHIENDQHLFAAPSAIALTRDNYKRMGMPSAYPTHRSDVIEEYTWEAEKLEIPLDLFMPIAYDREVVKFDWEKDKDPFWKLKDGQPEYGLGTTYGGVGGGLFYHNFQIASNQDMFNARCERELTK
jgi:hypothetical protein